MLPIYENKNIKIEIESSEIPWLKIFTQIPYKEMSEVPKEIRIEIYNVLDIIEKEMIAYYSPEKIILPLLETTCHMCIGISWHALKKIVTILNRCGAKSKEKQTCICPHLMIFI